MRKFAIAALPVLLLAACAMNPPAASAPPLAMKDGMLVNSQGLTVYVFDKDVPNSGKSSCNADCAVKWPPVAAKAGDSAQGAYTIVMRDDGMRQWAYRGRPVYTWPEDQEPGDKYGDGKNGIWHIVTQ